MTDHVMAKAGRVGDALARNGESVGSGNGTPPVSHVPDAKPLEYRAEVDSLEALQAERRALIPRYSALAAKFKGGAVAGTDASRKRHRALVAKRILIDLEQKSEKAPSEAALERMANADTEHIAFCEQLESEYTRFIVLENDIQEINEKIRSREIELYSYNAELKMQS